MAKICQLHADLHYFLCMEPVDMRKQFRGLQGIISEKYSLSDSYVLDHIKETKDEDMYKLLPEFWEDIN